jgi:hypothetical protein
MRHSCLLLLALAACSAREEGLRLHLQLTHRPAGDVRTQGTARLFTSDKGESLMLSRAHVTLSSVELFPCPGSSARRWLERLSPVATAHAHSASSPRRLGTPHVSSLERADSEPLVLGTLQPPPGSYCRASLYFGPADADAEGLPAAVDMVGKALRLEGEADSRPFLLESTRGAFADLTLEGLTLGPQAPEQVLRINLAYDRWLNGMDWSAPEAAAAQALSNLAASASAQPVQR